MNKKYQDTIYVLPDGTEVSMFTLIKSIRSQIELNPSDELEKLRVRRNIECFKIVDRGELWYNTLTNEQYNELREWRQAWLDVTETKEIPKTPSWINDKLEGEVIL